MRSTISLRLTLWHSLIFVIGAPLVFASAYWLLLQALEESTRDSIEFRLQQFASAHRNGGQSAVIDLCRVRTGGAQRAFFVRLTDSRGNTTFLRDAEDWAAFRPEQLAATPQIREKEWMSLRSPEQEVLTIVSQRLGEQGYLQVGHTAQNRKTLDWFRQMLLGILVILAFAGLAGGAFLARRALTPVRRITVGVRGIVETGKFDARVPMTGTGDELDELIGCLNTLLDRIDGLVRGMSEALDNVAHDLRTPMTRLRNIAHVALQKDGDKASCHEALVDCLEESERVLTMLNTLMDISEAQTGAMQLEREPVSVDALVEGIADLYRDVAEEKGITLRVGPQGGWSVLGDEGRLRRVMANLVDNAIKYTPSKGIVTIGTAAHADQVAIEVADTGMGIPAKELPRIWERLYRGDKSRSQRGLGLGLSFVKAIVEAHGGSVEVDSTHGSGAKFVIWLRRATA